MSEKTYSQKHQERYHEALAFVSSLGTVEISVTATKEDEYCYSLSEAIEEALDRDLGTVQRAALETLRKRAQKEAEENEALAKSQLDALNNQSPESTQ